MNFSGDQIESITRSVLRELRSRGVAVRAADRTSETETGPSNHVLLQKVITEDTLAAANAAGQAVSIPAGAVITPSGHDYIRHHAVRITSGRQSLTTAHSGVAIAVGHCPAFTSSVNMAKWNLISVGSEIHAAEAATAALPAAVVCEGGEPSVAACLLNRNINVRAAVITRNTDLSLLTTKMNPNVYCLDAAGWSIAELIRLFRQLTVPTSSVPASWQELTGVNQ